MIRLYMLLGDKFVTITQDNNLRLMPKLIHSPPTGGVD